MLANLQPPPEFNSWATSLCFLMSAILLAMHLVEKFRGKPSAAELQREVQSTHVSRELFEKTINDQDRRINSLEERMTREVTEIQGAMGEMEKRIIEAGADRMKELQKLVIDAVKSAAKNEGRLESKG